MKLPASHLQRSSHQPPPTQKKAPQMIDEVPSSSPAKGIVVGGAEGDSDMEGGLQHMDGDTVSQRR